MTQRERRLAIIAGGLFALFVLQGAVRGLFLSRVEDLRQKIAARQHEKARLLQFVSSERFLRDEWLRIYAMTLGADVSAARTRLDSMMKRLLEDSGLTRYSARMLEPFTDRKRAGLVLLRYTVVTAECDLRSFVQFLHNFYRQPYAMRIVSFNLEPLSTRRASVLKLTSLRVEAMLLPDAVLPALLIGALWITAALWMRAREGNFGTQDDDLYHPVLDETGSDSAMLDNALELLVMAGRSLPHAMMMMTPEAWGTKYHMSQDKRAFYEYHSAIMEPWDGPAAIALGPRATL